MKNKILTILMLLIIISIIGVTIYFANEKMNKFIENQTTEEKKQENNDSNYMSLDILSTKVEDLYQKTRIRKEIQEVPDYYIHEQFTNDSIITLTLENQVDSTEKNRNEDETIYEYNKEDFIKKAEKLWGKDIQYNIENYSGAAHCESYYYDKDTQNLTLRTGMDCDIQEKIVSNLIYAYETNDEIVLIEESLYLRYVNTDEKSSGIYNNIKDKELIDPLNENDINTLKSLEDNKNLLEQYKDSVTYYKYIFNKNNDETYYLSEFKRLTEEEKQKLEIA